MWPHLSFFFFFFLKHVQTAVLPQSLKGMIASQDWSNSMEPLLTFSWSPPPEAVVRLVLVPLQNPCVRVRGKHKQKKAVKERRWRSEDASWRWGTRAIPSSSCHE